MKEEKKRKIEREKEKKLLNQLFSLISDSQILFVTIRNFEFYTLSVECILISH